MHERSQISSRVAFLFMRASPTYRVSRDLSSSCGCTHTHMYERTTSARLGGGIEGVESLDSFARACRERVGNGERMSGLLGINET